jgi:hypothetical protein
MIKAQFLPLKINIITYIIKVVVINIIPIVWTEQKIENKNGEMAIFKNMVNI